VTWQLTQGDCVEVMRSMPEDSIDSVVCDPPYGLEFMGKEWDAPHKARIRERVDGRTNPRNGKSVTRTPESFTAGSAFQNWCEMWAKECLHVLKPGGHLLAFGGTRTYHRLACAIEDAGFEIRDCIQWIYGSGFPKSKNLGNGFGTALKPAHEPIVLARKPFSESSVARNVLEHGTGVLNIDGSRIPGSKPERGNLVDGKEGMFGMGSRSAIESSGQGRWPANLLLSHLTECNGECVEGCPVAELDRQSGTSKSVGGKHSGRRGTRDAVGGYGFDRQEINRPTDAGGSSRFFKTFEGEPGFFYCAKASRQERNAGLEGMPEKVASVGHQDAGTGRDVTNPNNQFSESRKRRVEAGLMPTQPRANHHPTVKPLALMRYLVKLVTPPGGVVLDPFAGSGTTLVAAIEEGLEAIGVEREAEYMEIAKRRITHAMAQMESEMEPEISPRLDFDAERVC